ncbi:unnamed protein product [Microthlaspi erraticum]|uniref:Leucine-rich repeat-containing N-terminal plant-type domain-containing protein n=1 Tax=Microthlaspi erraticum TaxID=1685480 RepID=A0A6D2HS65_9BRAS|nr:unnamed protein product [Microthlaspi erraticum]
MSFPARSGGNQQMQVTTSAEFGGQQAHRSNPRVLFQLVELTALALFNNRLQGTLSPSVSNLRNLQELDLYRNDLEGKLPKEIGLLSKIGNSISIREPWRDSIFNRKIERAHLLHLRENEFAGNIPASLGNCNQLTLLDLANSQLSGSIPSSFGFLKSLQELYLYNNSLEGNLPSSLINLKNLTRIDLSRNKLNGSISPLCGSSSISRLASQETDSKETYLLI